MLRKLCYAGLMLALALFGAQKASAGIITYSFDGFTPYAVSYDGSTASFWGQGANTAEYVTLNSALGLSRTEYYGPGGISITATGMSSNAAWASGYGLTPGSAGLGEGLVVDLATGQVHQVGFLGLVNQSPSFGVSNGGVAVGDADGARVAFSWTQAGGIQDIPAPSTSEFARAVSDQGNVVVGTATNSLRTSTAAIWRDGTFSFLEDPFLLASLADDLSPNGQNAAGFVGRFNFSTFETEQLAAGWNSLGTLSLFTDMFGNDVFGYWNSVTNNGFYGGVNGQGLGIVYDPYLGYVTTFDDWAFSNYGLTFDTPTRSVNDVYFDGTDYHFALEGSGRYVQAPANGVNAVPEPATWLMFMMGFLGLGAARLRERVLHRKRVS